MIWLVLGIMVLSALLFIVAPLLQKHAIDPSDSHELKDYKSQLAELEKSISAGNGDAAELEQLKTGLQRQILKLDGVSESSLRSFSRSVLLIVFLVFGGMTAVIYAQIGRPELTRFGSLEKMQPAPGPTQQDMRAAAELTPEQRAEMIQNMVEGLSAKLIDDPMNEEGWLRLLRARKVLGQNAEAQVEIDRFKSAFKDQPDVIEGILTATGWKTLED